MILSVILYLVGFIRTVFIILVIYYAIRLISKYIIPILFEKEINKTQERMKSQFRDQQREKKQKGEVTIEYNPKKNTDNQKGEYIDFEEVE